ncbi:MAG: ImmA/IrrE family metallo-endopeptidase [Clostridia bacterium]|nr:ImmA/IrrE family metallo-endopeptidase [Clostridia bacterium]
MTDTARTEQSKLPHWLYEKIERKVVDLYIELGIQEIPVDPFEIIRKRGYIAMPFSKIKDIDFLKFANGSNDAFSFFNPERNTYIIVYDDKKPLSRLRFTLMHEIGHIDLGHKSESNLARKMADCYASYALAPSPLIGLFTSGNKDEIQNEFGVSNECAEVCQKRYYKWSVYGGAKYKDYEQTLLDLIM